MLSMFKAQGSGKRLLWVYVAAIVAIAVLSPGIMVFAGDGGHGRGHDKVKPGEDAVIEAPPPAEEPVDQLNPDQPPEPPAEPETAAEPTEEPAEEPSVATEPEPAVEPADDGAGDAQGPPPADEPPCCASDDPTVPGGVVPVVVPGNPKVCEGGLKIDPGCSGTYEIPGYPDMFVTVAVTKTDCGPVFSFESDVPVVRVTAKGGTEGANVYDYDPATYGDGYLHSPVNPSGKYAGLSHIDFCFCPPEEPRGSIVVHKFQDDGATPGTWDSGEAMLEGWEFVLEDAKGVEVDRGVTDGDGELVFADLPLGCYKVKEILQNGWSSTTGLVREIVVGPGDPGCVWFGNVRDVYCKTFELTYCDKPDDVDLSVTFLLNGEPQELALTGEGSVYSAAIEVPYPYEITEIKWWADGPGGLVLLGATEDETLTGDKTNCFEYKPPANGAIHVYKYEDANGDGSYDEGEKMLPGWEFSLDLPLPSEDAMESIGIGITDGNGEIVFVDLKPGDYIVTEKLKQGWISTTGLSADAKVVSGRETALWFGNKEKEVVPAIDLAITKAADRDEAEPDGMVVYTLTYWNNSETPATNFTITDDFDERYMSVVNPADGVVSDGKITWTLSGPLSAADGKRTIIYAMRVKADMPVGSTNVDNVVVIRHPDDGDPSNNTDNERVVVVEAAEPTEEEPYLPFTGGEYVMLLSAAVVAALGGLVLRYRSDRAA